MSMTPLERAAEATLTGLAQQILDLDFEDPMAFEQVVTIGAEIERTAGRAVEDRGELEFFTRQSQVPA